MKITKETEEIYTKSTRKPLKCGKKGNPLKFGQKTKTYVLNMSLESGGIIGRQQVDLNGGDKNGGNWT